MNIDFYPANSLAPKTRAISELKIAAYAATEWIPNTPHALINGMADIARSAMVKEMISGHPHWCINPDLSYTDRQWSGFTSWILGVAFCRYAIEDEGFPFWSPVSSFSGKNSTGKTLTGNWLSSLPRSLFQVQKLGTSSNLLPDYVVGRITANNRYEFSFFESKGTKKSLDNRSVAPVDWISQANNGILSYKSIPLDINCNYIVATRVNPSAAKVETRRIITRVWKDCSNMSHSNLSVFAHFVAVHYVGVFQRLGFIRLAELIANRIRQDFDHQYNVDTDSEYELSERAMRVFQSLRDPQIARLGLRQIRFLELEDHYPRIFLGDNVYEIRILSDVLDIVAAILEQQLDEIPIAIQNMMQTIRELQGEYRNQGDVLITLNGIIVNRG